MKNSAVMLGGGGQSSPPTYAGFFRDDRRLNTNVGANLAVARNGEGQGQALPLRDDTGDLWPDPPPFPPLWIAPASDRRIVKSA
jgi:hypothetical protein